MTLKGKAWKFGDGISTDHIQPNRYFHLRGNLRELAKHVLEGARENFPELLTPGDFVVAGRNFGLGSSREFAPAIIKLAGLNAVIAVREVAALLQQPGDFAHDLWLDHGLVTLVDRFLLEPTKKQKLRMPLPQCKQIVAGLDLVGKDPVHTVGCSDRGERHGVSVGIDGDRIHAVRSRAITHLPVVWAAELAEVLGREEHAALVA